MSEADRRQQGRLFRMGRIIRFHALQIVVCSELEALADSLPKPDPLSCRRLASTLVRDLRVHHELEEAHVFPAIDRRLHRHSLRNIDFGRLVLEHREDRDAAQDLSEELVLLADEDAMITMEGLAYQARSLFRSVRRHVAHEAEVVLPMAASLLSDREIFDMFAAYEIVLARRLLPEG